MEEKKVIKLKKEEYSVREFIRKSIGKGKVSRVRIEYTPVGEKIIVATHRPGLVIGRKGEKIQELTSELKKKFSLQNPSIEIDEIQEPEFDAQIMADEIALALERMGPVKFKSIAYKTLQGIMKAGALGVEIKLSGKLPGARSKVWRFNQGYLKKTGESSNVVDRAQSIAHTKPGVAGVSVSILSPHVKLKDKIDIDDSVIEKMKQDAERAKDSEYSKKTKTNKKQTKSKK